MPKNKISYKGEYDQYDFLAHEIALKDIDEDDSLKSIENLPLIDKFIDDSF